MSRTLYHYPLSPFSRKVRIMLAEKGLEHDLVIEKYWERRREFLAMNPAAQVPVLSESGAALISDSTAICEYIEERYSEPCLLGNDPLERAEVRRIAGWFNNKFYYEVTKHMLDEKVMKFLRKEGAPSREAMRCASRNIHYHLDYIGFLTRQHTWLAGETFSYADISAAAQISVLDYLSDVPWNEHDGAKQWYALVKSRPCFRAVLEDRVNGFTPPSYYRDPDF